MPWRALWLLITAVDNSRGGPLKVNSLDIYTGKSLWKFCERALIPAKLAAFVKMPSLSTATATIRCQNKELCESDNGVPGNKEMWGTSEELDAISDLSELVDLVGD